MQEVWKSIEGYEGEYEVSNHGRVKSLPRPKWNGTNKGRILKIHKNRVTLRGKTHSVTRLVERAFPKEVTSVDS